MLKGLLLVLGCGVVISPFFLIYWLSVRRDRIRSQWTPARWDAYHKKHALTDWQKRHGSFWTLMGVTALGLLVYLVSQVGMVGLVTLVFMAGRILVEMSGGLLFFAILGLPGLIIVGIFLAIANSFGNYFDKMEKAADTIIENAPKVPSSNPRRP